MMDEFEPDDNNEPLVRRITKGKLTKTEKGAVGAAVILIVAAVVLGAVALGYALNPKTCPIDHQLKQNVYVFGISFEDWGNWVAYYDGQGYTLSDQGVITPGSAKYFDSVYGQAPPVSSIDIVNSDGRFSNGRNGLDFVADYFRLKKLVSSDISHIPSDNGIMVNFAVGGSTADGNVHNIPGVALPHNYDQVAGKHGFNAQVSDFITKLAANQNAIIKDTDIFLYSSIGSNDISLIAGCTNITACIINFTDTHLANIQTLYDAGMRRMILSYADSSVFGYNPATHKANTTGYYVTVFDALSATIFDTATTGFLAQLYAKLVDLSSSGMSDLDLNVIPLSSLISDVSSNPVKHGIRKTLPNDRDPRNYPLGTTTSAFPFPTLYDTFTNRGAVLLDTYYNDDNHPTEDGYHDYASYFINAMTTQYIVCNPVV